MKSSRDLLKRLGLACAAVACLALPTAVSMATLPAGAAGVALGSFHPLSVTFVSLNQGWSLGIGPCKATGACLALAETADAGRTWSQEPLPARLVAAADRPVTNGLPAGKPGYVRLPAVLYGGYGLNVRFATSSDGWIWGGLPVSPSAVQAELWSTHDGGATWHQLAVLPGTLAKYYGSVLDLEAAGGYAYLMAPNDRGGVSIESTPASSDSWRLDKTPNMYQPAGGGPLQGAIVLQGGNGWALTGNDRGVTGSARRAPGENGVWSSWPAPCAKVGDSFVVPAASSRSDLVTACQMGGFASSLSKYAPPGAKLGSWWLYFSHDGGQTWAPGAELGTNSYPFSGLLASAGPSTVFVGYGFAGSAPPAELLASFDGGHTWAPVRKGDFAYLGFTSAQQGVAILRASPSNVAATQMVMTFDGGRHWSAVRL
jgi:photosystem II stability/assembly factor-like uncharacterized protein